MREGGAGEAGAVGVQLTKKRDCLSVYTVAMRKIQQTYQALTCMLNNLYMSSMISMMSSAKTKDPPADNEMHLDSASGKSAKEIKGWDFHDKEA